jgi:hypothetical protein
MTYVDQFEGMATVPVTLEQMLETRSLLRAEILRRLSDRQKGFLVSLLRAEPDWSLLACPHASELPGLKWKLENLLKFREQKPDAFEAAVALAGESVWALSRWKGNLRFFWGGIFWVIRTSSRDFMAVDATFSGEGCIGGRGRGGRYFPPKSYPPSPG